MELITFVVYSFYLVLVLFQDSFHSHCCIPDLISWIYTVILHWSWKVCFIFYFSTQDAEFLSSISENQFYYLYSNAAMKEAMKPTQQKIKSHHFIMIMLLDMSNYKCMM